MTYDEIIKILDKEAALTQEEEKVVFEYYEKHPSLDLKNRIAMKNIGLIHQTIIRYANLGVEYEDLWQTGFFGLLKAVDLFDYKKGFKFSTYAFNHIRSFTQRYFQNNAHRVRIPNYAQDHLYRIINFITEYESMYGIEPSHSEIAEKFELDESFVDFLIETNNNNKNTIFDYVNHDENFDYELVYCLKDDKAEDLFNEVIRKADSEKFLSIIKKALKKSEYDVIMKRFGFENNGVPMTFGAIAEERKCSKQCIQQLEARAIKKLRHPHIQKKFLEFVN